MTPKPDLHCAINTHRKALSARPPLPAGRRLPCTQVRPQKAKHGVAPRDRRRSPQKGAIDMHVGAPSLTPDPSERTCARHTGTNCDGEGGCSCAPPTGAPPASSAGHAPELPLPRREGTPGWGCKARAELSGALTQATSRPLHPICWVIHVFIVIIVIILCNTKREVATITDPGASPIRIQLRMQCAAPQ